MLLGSLLLGLAGASYAAEGESLRFNRDIRPILADKCFACHGPDKNARQAELRLDTHEGALADLGGHAAIVPGDTAKSELVRRIKSDDPDEAMPPKKHPKQLTTAERKLLEDWVAQGAPWEGHWAYIPPTRPVPPATSQGDKLANPIDRFIAARLEAQKLPTSPAADRRTLARRLSFDLTGLPPQAADVEAFVNDVDPRAYEKLVDKLLASPHYGEQMALYWLDLVRFADTAGYHSDNPRDIAPYRDYVIRAFNENLPFDRFTIEQLAGDLLPQPTLSQQVASGYNRLLQTTEEGGAQAKEYEAIYFADRVRNFSTVWMASTMGCCQCHDHKFDPFSQKDFYSMAAFFADVREAPIGRREPGVPVPSTEQVAEQQRLDERMAELRKKLDTTSPELAAAQASWEQTFKQETKSAWTQLEVTAAKSSQADVKLEVQADGSVLAQGASPDKDVYTVTLKLPGAAGLKRVTALRLELLPDELLPKHGPGRSSNGGLAIGGFTVEAAKSVVDKAEPVTLAKAAASYLAAAAPDAIRTWKAAALQDEKKVFSFAISDAGQIGQQNQVVLPLQKPLAVSADTILTCTIKQEAGKQRTIGRFRISATDQASPAPALGASLEDIAATIAKPEQERSQAAKAALAAHYRTFAPLLEPVRKELAATEKQKEQLAASIPRSLVSVAMAPKMLRIKARGNWMDESGEVVEPAAPAFMKPIKAAGSRATRLDLAQWLVAADHPLTSRVLVNRLWKLCFGQGLVKSLEDLGLQGDVPTHPELLDWLAVECRESGWDVKHMVKLMVMSNAYRQTSVASKLLRERDPYNKLLGRQGRFRLDAEALRDNALAQSGLLVDRVGGASVKPYQPAGYWTFLNFPKREYPQDHGDDLYRRSLYTHWQRSFLHPSLLVFDAPSREECVADRPRSNTPQQALVLLNDPIYVEAYRVLAERILRSGGADFDGRLRWTFARVLSRPPKPEEAAALKALYDHQLAHYQQNTDAAEQAISVGEWPVAKDLSAAELAAWTAVARTMMNLHETITRL